MSNDIAIATKKDLNWLNNGFDGEAMTRLDAAYFETAINASPTPRHWRFLDIEATEDRHGDSA
jgi:hypothetical protein